MIKKILIVVFLIAAVGFGLVKILFNVSHLEWGHHFSFENELGIELDSLEITVGDVKTTFRARSDSLRYFEGNIDVPEKDYPHKVTFEIYSNGKTIILKADSFNCYNCDGNHQYKLKETGAEYKFLN